MALIKLGGGVTDIRGAIGGTVFSRGRGGAIARKNTKPVNPRSTSQNTRRAMTAYIAKSWSNELTEQQRIDWRAYAAGTVSKNRLGETISGAGNAAYMRLNTLMILGGGVLIKPAPLAMGHGGGVTIAFTAESDTRKIQLAEPGGSFDADLDLHKLWLFMGLPAEPGRIAPPKGFHYIGTVAGNSTTPPTFPLEIDAPYTMRAGQTITLRAMWHDEHYRVAGPFFGSATAAPSI